MWSPKDSVSQPFRVPAGRVRLAVRPGCFFSTVTKAGPRAIGSRWLAPLPGTVRGGSPGDLRRAGR